MADEQLFQLGNVAGTPGALAAFERNSPAVGIWTYLRRHVTGDWGEVDASDAEINNRAVVEGERVHSTYTMPDGTKLWIVTEGDRSTTTLMLPEEY